MEVHKRGRYYVVKNSHGPVPHELKGLWTNQHQLQNAMDAFSAKVRSKIALTPTEKTEKRRENAKAFLSGT